MTDSILIDGDLDLQDANKLINVPTPTEPGDAVPKSYVDESGGGGGDGNATSIQDVPVSTEAPSTGDVLEYDGEQWTPGSGASTFIFNQLAPSTLWEIEHNLNAYPPVFTQDSAGTEVIGDVNYPDANHVTVSFTNPEGGTAYLAK